MNALKLRMLICLVFVALFVFAVSPYAMAQEELNKAIEQYNNGQRQSVYPIIRAYAEKGNARAQTILGLFYNYGDVVSFSHEESFKWYRRGAHGGDPRGQYNLASRYYRGKGTDQDYVLAYVWFSLYLLNPKTEGIEKDKAEKRIERIEQREFFGNDMKRAKKLINKWQAKFKSMKK